MVAVGWHRLWKASWVLLLCALLTLVTWGSVGAQDSRDQWLSRKRGQSAQVRKVHHTVEEASERLGLKPGEKMPAINQLAQQHVEETRKYRFSSSAVQRSQFEDASKRQHQLFKEHDRKREKELARRERRLDIFKWTSVRLAQDLRDKYHKVRESCQNKLGNESQPTLVRPSEIIGGVELFPKFNKQGRAVTWDVVLTLQSPKGAMDRIFINGTLLEVEALLGLIQNKQVEHFKVNLYENALGEILDNLYPYPAMQEPFSDESLALLVKFFDSHLAQSMDGLSLCDTKVIMEQLKKCKLCLISSIAVLWDQSLKPKE